MTLHRPQTPTCNPQAQFPLVTIVLHGSSAVATATNAHSFSVRYLKTAAWFLLRVAKVGSCSVPQRKQEIVINLRHKLRCEIHALLLKILAETFSVHVDPACRAE